jgi:hypothetical protein
MQARTKHRTKNFNIWESIDIYSQLVANSINFKPSILNLHL